MSLCQLESLYNKGRREVTECRVQLCDANCQVVCVRLREPYKPGKAPRTVQKLSEGIQVEIWLKFEVNRMSKTMGNSARQDYILANAAKSALDSLINRIENHVPKTVSADFKRARTIARNAMLKWIEPYDENSRKRLQMESSTVTIGVVSDSSKKAQQTAYVRYVRDVRMEAYQDGGRDHILDLSEVAMNAVCAKCNGMLRAKGCTLYDALQKFEIEFWDANHPHCQYAGTGEVSE